MDKEPITKILQVNNQIDELARVAEFLEELGDDWELPMPLVLSLNLVLEEALTNTILYGFDDENQHTITVGFSFDGEILGITLMDDGHEYDPTLKEDPDITLAAEDRQIGGLGIFLIKKTMDTVIYQRKENKNYLILTKKIKS
ncbi:MAG: ATP-binding protein [Bacteroidales bacterium]|nr:ATP-binding protein [Bacteroidales bacterium]